jgi:hypothetical protein
MKPQTRSLKQNGSCSGLKKIKLDLAKKYSDMIMNCDSNVFTWIIYHSQYAANRVEQQNDGIEYIGWRKVWIIFGIVA